MVQARNRRQKDVSKKKVKIRKRKAVRKEPYGAEVAEQLDDIRCSAVRRRPITRAMDRRSLRLPMESEGLVKARTRRQKAASKKKVKTRRQKAVSKKPYDMAEKPNNVMRLAVTLRPIRRAEDCRPVKLDVKSKNMTKVSTQRQKGNEKKAAKREKKAVSKKMHDSGKQTRDGGLANDVTKRGAAARSSKREVGSPSPSTRRVRIRRRRPTMEKKDQVRVRTRRQQAISRKPYDVEEGQETFVQRLKTRVKDMLTPSWLSALKTSNEDADTKSVPGRSVDQPANEIDASDRPQADEDAAGSTAVPSQSKPPASDAEQPIIGHLGLQPARSAVRRSPRSASAAAARGASSTGASSVRKINNDKTLPSSEVRKRLHDDLFLLSHESRVSKRACANSAGNSATVAGNDGTSTSLSLTVIPDDSSVYQHDVLAMDTRSLEHHKHDLAPKDSESAESELTAAASASDKSAATLQPSSSFILDGDMLNGANQQPTKPSSSISTFTSSLNSMNESSSFLNASASRESSYYAGKTTYGGAAAYRKVPLAASAAVQPSIKSVLPAKQTQGSGATTVTSSTAKRILDTLEKMAAPPATRRSERTAGTVNRSAVDALLAFKPSPYLSRSKGSRAVAASLGAPASPALLPVAKLPLVSAAGPSDDKKDAVTNKDQLTSTAYGSDKTGGKVMHGRNRAHYTRMASARDEAERAPCVPNLPTSYTLPSITLRRIDLFAPKQATPTASVFSAETRPVCDKPPKGEAPKDNVSTYKTLKDDASKHEALEDEAPQNNAAKDEAPHVETPEDDAAEDDAPKDEAAKDKATKDEASMGEAPQSYDEACNDEASKGEATEDEAAKSEPIMDKAAKVEAPEDAGAKDETLSGTRFHFSPPIAYSPSTVDRDAEVQTCTRVFKFSGPIDVRRDINATQGNAALSDSSPFHAIPLAGDAQSSVTLTSVSNNRSAAATQLPALGSSATSFALPNAAPNGWAGTLLTSREAGSWECQSCLLSNKAAANVCGACNASRRPMEKLGSVQEPPSNVVVDIFKHTPSGWECGTCMVRNDSDRLACLACGSAKPFKGKNAAASESSDSLDVFKHAASGWECSVCMVRNTSDKVKCIACASAKPSAQQNVASCGSSYPVDIFKQAPSGWECGTCMVRNGSDKVKCVACGSAKPSVYQGAAASALPGPVDIFKQVPSGWECGVCMLRNGSDKAKCVACGSAKPAAPQSATSYGSAGLLDIFKQEPGCWECTICMVRNGSDKVKCVACGSAKPSDIQNTMPSGPSGCVDIFKQVPSGWECSVCMVNNSSDKAMCVACGSAKLAAPQNGTRKPVHNRLGEAAASKASAGGSSEFKLGCSGNPAPATFGIYGSGGNASAATDSSHAAASTNVGFGGWPAMTAAAGFGGLPAGTTEAKFGTLPAVTTEIKFGALPAAITNVKFGGLHAATTVAGFGGQPAWTTDIKFGALPAVTTEVKFGSLPAVPGGFRFGDQRPSTAGVTLGDQPVGGSSGIEFKTLSGTVKFDDGYPVSTAASFSQSVPESSLFIKREDLPDSPVSPDPASRTLCSTESWIVFKESVYAAEQKRPLDLKMPSFGFDKPPQKAKAPAAAAAAAAATEGLTISSGSSSKTAGDLKVPTFGFERPSQKTKVPTAAAAGSSILPSGSSSKPTGAGTLPSQQQLKRPAPPAIARSYASGISGNILELLSVRRKEDEGSEPPAPFTSGGFTASAAVTGTPLFGSPAPNRPPSTQGSADSGSNPFGPGSSVSSSSGNVIPKIPRRLNK